MEVIFRTYSKENNIPYLSVFQSLTTFHVTTVDLHKKFTLPENAYT